MMDDKLQGQIDFFPNCMNECFSLKRNENIVLHVTDYRITNIIIRKCR